MHNHGELDHMQTDYPADNVELFNRRSRYIYIYYLVICTVSRVKET